MAKANSKEMGVSGNFNPTGGSGVEKTEEVVDKN
jgi:hypothetical protein